MAYIRIKATGIDKVIRKLGSDAADRLHEAIETDIGVEARKQAVQAAKDSPVETGALRASLLSSPRREGRLTYYWGTYLPYGLRQEYEHKTKKGWMRAAWRVGKRETEKTIVLTIKRKLS